MQAKQRANRKGRRRGAANAARTARRPQKTLAKGRKRSHARGAGRASGRAAGRSHGRAAFAGLEKGDGCAALVKVGERAGRAWEEDSRMFAARLPAMTPQGTAFVGRHISALRRVCRVFAAVGHLQRGKILLKLVEGPATYRALRALTGLKAGPLYHHVNQLRLAGLVLPKQRDLYELTRAGRNLIVASIALEPLTRDLRRRPIGLKP